MAVAGVRRKTWGATCATAAVALAVVALVIVMSKLTVLFDDPFSFAALVLVVAAVGAVACAREAHRALT